MYSLISNVPLLVRLATIRPHHEEVGAIVDIKTTEAITSVVVVFILHHFRGADAFDTQIRS